MSNIHTCIHSNIAFFKIIMNALGKLNIWVRNMRILFMLVNCFMINYTSFTPPSPPPPQYNNRLNVDPVITSKLIW